jgi:putative selenate reductase molybdopterin-binding subunit
MRDREKVTGRIGFLSEWRIPGALHAVVVRSPWPHARVIGIDVRGAEALPGIVAVYTHEDVPAQLYNPAGEPPDDQLDASADRRLLTDEAQHVGDGVAVVLAASQHAARACAASIKIEWEPLTPAVGFHNGCVIGEMTSGDDDVEDALATAQVTVNATYWTQAVQHMCLEPHACAAVFEPGTSHVTVWTNAQTPSDVRRICCEVLGLPMTALHVRKVNEGGGFGSKQEIYEEPLVAWLALRHRRPVQLAYTRAEEFIAGRSRHASKVQVRLGATRAGVISAITLDAQIDSGAYASHAAFVLGNALSAGYYNYPWASHAIRGQALRTNVLPGGAYRGYGSPQSLFAVEQAIDELAARVGQDPFDIRAVNATGNTHPLFDEGPSRLSQLLQLARRRSDWDNPIAPPRGRGMAMATMLNTTGDGPYEHTTALLRLNEDGTLTLGTGTTDCGTGSSAALAQLAARAFGISSREVEVCEGDTTCGLNDLGSFSQRTIFIGGGAVLAAVASLRTLVLAEAARQTGAENLLIAEGMVRDESGRVTISLADLARSAAKRGALLAAESYTPQSSPPSYAVCVAEVNVDCHTGAITVERFISAIDCGRVLHPAAAYGQVAGAVAQGIGFALYEDLRPDSNEAVLTLEQHGVPLAGDIPDIDVVFLDDPDDAGPEGAKGVGEVAIAAVAPAIGNAVAAATGIRHRRLPLRPARVWEACRAS